MVSQKTITGLDFIDLEDYHKYILDSYINGNLMQVEKLIKEFSKLLPYITHDIISVTMHNPNHFFRDIGHTIIRHQT